MNKYLLIRKLNQLDNSLQMYLGSVRRYRIIYNQSPQIPVMKKFNPEIRRCKNKCIVNANSANMSFQRLPMNIRQRYFHQYENLVNDYINNSTQVLHDEQIIQKLIVKLKYNS